MDGPTADTLAGDVVSIVVPADGPYGVVFHPDSEGCAAVVSAFQKLPNGKFGPIQRDGGVHIGDILFEVNDTSLMNRKFDEAVKIISDRNILRKVFKFMNPKDYQRKKRGISSRAAPTDSKNSFLSTVKRTRLSDIGGKKVAEYEIACQFRVASEKVQKEIVYQWSVWKRFSLFEDLHRELKRTLGWRLDSIDFPSAHTFVMNKLSPEFVTQRRDELKEYWHKVVSIDKVTDFQKHHCSAELKDFLEVEANIRKEVAASADMIEDVAESKEGTETKDPRPASVQRAKSARMPSARRLSVRQSSQSSTTARTDESPVAKPASEEARSSPSPPPPPRPAPPAHPPSAPSAAPAAAPAPPSAAVPPPPPPPPKPPAPAAPPAAAPAPTPAAPPASQPSSGAIPPKATGARANLLGAINALRKD